ncbi:MAG: DUF1800 domain-containing protein [Blastocatellia bacterium]|nr:DUF1800 domain-containing protein [Blastocatellia bacterium]
MKKTKRIIIAFACLVVSVSALIAQDDPNPNSPAPQLISGPDRTRVLAVDEITTRGSTPIAGRDALEVGVNSRATIFLARQAMQEGEPPGAFRVYVTRGGARFHELSVDSISRTRNGDTALSITVFDRSGYREQPVADGDYWIYVTWRGMASNALKVGLGRSGGQIRPIAIQKAESAPVDSLVGYRFSADRIRLMEQATFGPSPAVDQRIRRVGPRIWISEQFEEPYPYIPYPEPPQMPLVIPADCTQTTFPACYNERYTMIPLQQWFFREAAYSPAQLRLRTAWALGQIWVTSGVTTSQASHAITYQKLLMDSAFGNYRKLMEDATLNPTMGNYLDMVRSTRQNPNENYPREILQLFSIGLFMLNQDGTLQTNGQGQPIPTFDQEDINDLSKVMTGWTFCNGAGCNGAQPGIVNYKAPMTLTPANHDLSAKTLLNYPGATVTSIPACTDCTNDTAIRTYATNSLRAALDNIFNHPNVGPYIGKLMIQHMVTSDPSPAYVSRVAAAFNNNGQNVRGDMKAVVRAILLDPEARGDIKTAPRFGKLREPVQLMTALTRIFPAKAFNGTGTTDGGTFSLYGAGMGQNPFNSPTVFNYFPPDHVIAGTTILAPEFDLLNTGTSVKRTNMLSVLIFDGFASNISDTLRGTSLDYSEYVPISIADETGAMLLDALNMQFLHGTMSPAHRSIIQAAVQAVPASNPTQRVKTAAYLLAASSQYQVQR